MVSKRTSNWSDLTIRFTNPTVSSVCSISVDGCKVKRGLYKKGPLLLQNQEKRIDRKLIRNEKGKEDGLRYMCMRYQPRIVKESELFTNLYQKGTEV